MVKVNVVGFIPAGSTFTTKQRGEVLQLYILEKGEPQLYSNAYYGEMSRGFNVFDFINPVGTFYASKKDQPNLDFSAQRLHYEKETKLADFSGDVRAQRKPLTLTCMVGSFLIDSEIFHCEQEVKVVGLDPAKQDEITIHSHHVDAFFRERYSLHKGQVVGKIKRPFIHEPPTDFESEQLSFYFDLNQANLDGNVKVWHGEFTLMGRRGEILLENYNKKLKYFTLNDDVVVEQKLPKNVPGGHRTAYAERMEGIRSEGVVVLTGAPRVIQGKDVVKGNKITLRQGASLIEVDDAASNLIYGNQQR